MREKKETLWLLKGHSCLTCRFSWKSKGILVVFYYDSGLPLPTPRICDHDNIVIHRPQGREYAMTKEVNDLDYCPLYEKLRD